MHFAACSHPRSLLVQFYLVRCLVALVSRCFRLSSICISPSIILVCRFLSGRVDTLAAWVASLPFVRVVFFSAFSLVASLSRLRSPTSGLLFVFGARMQVRPPPTSTSRVSAAPIRTLVGIFVPPVCTVRCLPPPFALSLCPSHRVPLLSLSCPSSLPSLSLFLAYSLFFFFFYLPCISYFFFFFSLFFFSFLSIILLFLFLHLLPSLCRLFFFLSFFFHILSFCFSFLFFLPVQSFFSFSPPLSRLPSFISSRLSLPCFTPDLHSLLPFSPPPPPPLPA